MTNAPTIQLQFYSDSKKELKQIKCIFHLSDTSTQWKYGHPIREQWGPQRSEWGTSTLLPLSFCLLVSWCCSANDRLTITITTVPISTKDEFCILTFWWSMSRSEDRNEEVAKVLMLSSNELSNISQAGISRGSWATCSAVYEWIRLLVVSLFGSLKIIEEIMSRFKRYSIFLYNIYYDNIIHDALQNVLRKINFVYIAITYICII